MNDVERLESLRGRVQHLGTVSIEDTRWLWEMARREVLARMLAECEPEWTFPVVPPLEPLRKRCQECGGDGVSGWQCDGLHNRQIRCPECGGEGYQPLENPE